MQPKALAIAAASLFATLSGAEISDISVPLGDGSLLIRVNFIRINEFGDYIPELNLRVINKTASSWNVIKIRFDMGGLCDSESRQWSRTVSMSLGWSSEAQVVQRVSDLVVPLMDQVKGCETEIIEARLVTAEGRKAKIEGVADAPPDFRSRLLEIKAKRDAELAQKAERERIEAEREAKEAAAAAARRKRAAAEQRKRDAEIAARAAEARAAREAAAQRERAELEAKCRIVYRNTSEKKVSDLTVREAQQVQACQALGLYAP